MKKKKVVIMEEQLKCVFNVFGKQSEVDFLSTKMQGHFFRKSFNSRVINISGKKQGNGVQTELINCKS